MATSNLDHDRLAPLSARRRWLILGLAIATACVVLAMLLDPPGGVKRTRRVPDDAPACAPGQDRGCVGGTVQVIVAPPSPQASR